MIDGDAGEKKQADDSRGNIIQNNTHQTRTRQVTSKPELLRNTEPGKLRELQTNSQTEGQRTAAVNLKHHLKIQTTSRTNGAFKLHRQRDGDACTGTRSRSLTRTGRARRTRTPSLPFDAAGGARTMIAVSVQAYCGRSPA